MTVMDGAAEFPTASSVSATQAERLAGGDDGVLAGGAGGVTGSSRRQRFGGPPVVESLVGLTNPPGVVEAAWRLRSAPKVRLESTAAAVR